MGCCLFLFSYQVYRSEALLLDRQTDRLCLGKQMNDCEVVWEGVEVKSESNFNRQTNRGIKWW